MTMPGMFVMVIILAVITLLLTATTVVVGRRLLRMQVARLAQEETAKAQAGDRYYGESGPSVRENNLRAAHNAFKYAAFGVLALALLLTFISSATIVSTKNVGIVTEFGKPVGSLSNGFHMVAPWDKVTELDAAIQTDSHYKDEKPSCVSVRIVRQAVACADVSIRWRIREGASDELFKDYRGFENIRDSLVTRELNATMNQEFKSYDPLGLDANGQSTTPSSQELSDRVTTDIRSEIGDQIDVLNVIIGVVHFDGNTQSRVDALQAQVAQTRIATQAVRTAEEQALANKKLSESLNNDPNVLVSKCYDLVSEMLNKGMTPPVAFSCWPGGNSSVVVPATK